MTSNSKSLFEFLDAANNCAQESRNDNAVALGRCAELDEFIARSVSARVSVPVAAMLRLSVRGMLCASINTALIGYRAGIFPTLRASLEAACYAQEIENKPHLSDIWLNRHESSEAHKNCRKAFGDAVRNTCKRAGDLMPGNEGLVSRIYESMIDDGAHPNVKSILRSIKITETDTHHEFAIGFVIPANVEILLFCCYEIGLFTSWLLGDFENIDPHFWEEASKLNDVKNRWEQELASKGYLTSL